MSSLSDDVINAVPQSLRDAAYALGATRSETIRQVILPAALPGIMGGILLAASRAIGETMIVVMAAGLSANLTANPLDSVTTVTVQIVTLLVGDQEFDSAKTLAAFALGLLAVHRHPGFEHRGLAHRAQVPRAVRVIRHVDTQTKRRAIDVVNASLKKRYAREARFRRMGLGAVILGLVFVSILFLDIVGKGYTAFVQTHVEFEVYFDPAIIDPEGTRDMQAIARADFRKIARAPLKAFFPEVSGERDKRALNKILSSGAPYQLLDMVRANPDLIGQRVTVDLIADDDIDMLIKGHIDRNAPPEDRRVNDKMIGWIDRLEAEGLIKTKFNTGFFTNGDSREPELAGIGGAVAGSFYTLLVTLLLSFPIGVAAAVYLEEFAPKNRWTDLIEVNINNLAAVPSIVFGLLGLAMFINLFGLPRSAPLVGGLVLTLMTLPTIIASRAALKSVPPSIREAALGVGASRMQTVFHHVVPLAMPGMLTGTIIGMAQALGETAPLLMIGMVAFIVDVPGGPMDPSTVLPVQVYLWADSPERAFVERTSAAIIVLLAFLIAMNTFAVICVDVLNVGGDFGG